VESYDLSTVFARMDSFCDPADGAYKNKRDALLGYTNWGKTPDEAIDKLIRLGLVLDAIVEEAQLDAVAIRCWTEMQELLGISPCVLLSEMNERDIVAACEVDVCNAIPMFALQAALSSTHFLDKLSAC